MTNEAKKLAGQVMEAIKEGFLASEYLVTLDSSGVRTYRQKPEDTSDVEMDGVQAKEIDAMAENLHSPEGASFFKLDDVKSLFASADEIMVKKLCHDLRHNIFDDLFIVTKEQSTGEFLFVKKSN